MDAPPPRITVEISDTQRHLRADHAQLDRVCRLVLESEGHDRGWLSVVLVDDPAIRRINRQHLDHDWATDVVTFPLEEAAGGCVSGEIVLSAEMAAATAQEAGTSAHDELVLYLVHGLLHLCGYDDRTPEQTDRMRQREAEFLARAGIENTFSRVGAGDRLASPVEARPC